MCTVVDSMSIKYMQDAHHIVAEVATNVFTHRGHFFAWLNECLQTMWFLIRTTVHSLFISYLVPCPLHKREIKIKTHENNGNNL